MISHSLIIVYNYISIGPRHMLVEVMLKSVRVNLYFCHEVALNRRVATLFPRCPETPF